MASGHLADTPLTTGYEPKLKYDLKKKSISEDSDATPIDDQNLDNFSEFSRVTRCADSSVSHVSFCGSVYTETNQLRETGSRNTVFSRVPCVGENVLGLRKNLQMGNLCPGRREREERQKSGSVFSVDESISRKTRRHSDDAGIKISHSRLTQQEIFSDERDLRDHHERRLQQAIFGENSAQRKLYSTENDVRSRIRKEEIQNMH